MARVHTRGVVAVLIAWAGLFAYLAAIEPVLHDGWYLVVEQTRRPFSASAFLDFVRHVYVADNPRVGQWLAYVAFGSIVGHVVLAAAFAVATLVGAFVLAHARWPRAGDGARLAVIAALAFVALPNPGQMFCYRPFAANYVWGFAITTAFAVPYRLALAAPARARGIAAALGMFVLGVAAGMTNEHTGPAAICAAGAAVELLRRRDRRVPAWAIAGAIGLVAGVALLIGAPGQDVRYHGLADRSSLVGNVLDRGALGNLRLIGTSMLYATVSWLAIAGCLIATGRARGPSMRWRRDVLVLAAAALAIVVTALVSPKQGARLFYAPSLLLVAAAARALDEATRACRIATAIVTACAAITAITCAAILIVVQRAGSADAADRAERLAAAAPNSVPAVPAFRHFAPTWWTYGDDFRSASMRERVARRAWQLDDVTLASDDAHVIATAGVSLALVIEPPDPAAASVADPTGDGFSEQVFTADGLATIDARFRAAIAAIVLRATPPVYVALRARGLPAAGLGDRPVDVAWWNQGGAIHTPAADAPLAAATHVLRVGGDARPLDRRDGDFAAWTDTAPAGAYLLLACDARVCHVLAARR
jgi:hypothetical protein